jgi:lipoprotein-anchoring transpeptidase ErfK/SrfK
MKCLKAPPSPVKKWHHNCNSDSRKTSTQENQTLSSNRIRKESMHLPKTLCMASALNLIVISSAFAASATPAPTPVRHGAIDGSFSDGKLVLGKSIPVNGFHQGLPTLVLVDMGSHTTFVLQKQTNDRIVKVYSASDSVGSDKTPTPPGPYWVAVKLKYPVWLPPKDIDPKQKAVQPYNKDHKNPLGVARIGLNKWGINLHGTNQPGKIRQSISHGCIRHSNNDIMKIYDMVSIGTPVIITDQFVGTTFTKSSFDNHGKHKKSK